MQGALARQIGRLTVAYWEFFVRPSNARPLGFLRIATALVALAQFWMLRSYLLQLYGNTGFVQWAVVEGLTEAWVPSIGKLALLLARVGVSAADCVHLVFTVYVVSLVSLAAGFCSRLSAIVACVTHALSVSTGYNSIYGVDTMLQIALFYCSWMPVGESMSLDQKWKGRLGERSWLATLSLRVLQIHLCVIYWNSGSAKMLGAQWRSGNGIWFALMEPQFAVFDFSWLASLPLLALFICWGVMLLEAGYPILIWPRQTRTPCLCMIILLHIGIAVCMGLTLFSLMMIVLNVSAFGIRLIEPELATPLAEAPWSLSRKRFLLGRRNTRAFR